MFKHTFDLINEQLIVLNTNIDKLLIELNTKPTVILRFKKFIIAGDINNRCMIWPRQCRAPNDIDSLPYISELKNGVEIAVHRPIETSMQHHYMTAGLHMASTGTAYTNTSTTWTPGNYTSTVIPIPTPAPTNIYNFELINNIMNINNNLPRNLVRTLRRIECASNWCIDRLEGIKKYRADLAKQQAKWMELLKAEETGFILSGNKSVTGFVSALSQSIGNMAGLNRINITP